MGVAGCGKTTISELLKPILRCPVVDADNFHSQENINKMQNGIPLNKADRVSWAKDLFQHIDTCLLSDSSLIVSCSALSHHIQEELERRSFVLFWLVGDYNLIFDRLRLRSDHFFDPTLLKSQFDSLEPPSQASKLDTKQPKDAIVDQIIETLKNDK